MPTLLMTRMGMIACYGQDSVEQLDLGGGS